MAASTQPVVTAQRPWRELGRDQLLRVHEYHCSACAGERPQPEAFAHASISIVRSGVFGIRTEREPRLLSAGFVLLGNAGQSYEASHEHGGGDRCLVFEFHDRALEELADSERRGARSQPFARNVVPPLPRVEALQRLALQHIDGGGPGSELGLEQLGLALAQQVLAHAGSGSPRPVPRTLDAGRTRDRMFASLTQIERAADEPLSLAELAQTAGLSPFHFLRQFKREFGVTPHRFLVQTRIRRAVALLLDSERPVTEIAYAVGFGDLSNFMHAFRSEVGCSPGRLRRGGVPLG